MTLTTLNTVALVEDDDAFREAVVEQLELEGLSVVAFRTAETALKKLDADFAGVVITDLRMPGMDGRQLTDRLRAVDPDLPVIMMTGHGDIAEAVDAMKRGAYDFLPKPFEPDRLMHSLRRALEKRALILDNRRLAARGPDTDWPLPLTGESRAAEVLRQAISQLAEARLDVLIEGETGSGKEAVARAIHAGGRGRGLPFVAVACGALSEAGAESQLMGHEAGAFPGAVRKRAGQIEQSDQGSLFLDEVDLAPPSVQVMLLRVLEEREILPLGAVEPRALDLRILASTKADLDQALASGALREDLFYRLNVVRLRVPPLRERREDAPFLFARFLERACDRLGREPPPLDKTVRRRLLEHTWPGNLRELSNFAQQIAMGWSDKETLTGPAIPTLSDQVAAYEAELIREALTSCHGDVRAAAAMLRLPRKTLYDKLSKYDVRPADHR
jgi:two-component system, NtrC family, C4-dicarboxylate transport response regulator DctD